MILKPNTMYWDDGYFFIDKDGYLYNFTRRNAVVDDSSFPYDNHDPETMKRLQHIEKHGVEMVPKEVNYADSQG